LQVDTRFDAVVVSSRGRRGRYGKEVAARTRTMRV
jgi:hypothetical protein